MYREAPAPRAPITIAYRAYKGEKVFAFGGVLAVLVGVVTTGVVNGHAPPLVPLVMLALFMSPFAYAIANELRPVAVTIDHARGVASFRPSLFSGRKEIVLALVKGVEIETAVSITRSNRGPSGPPTPVGRICLVLEDDKIPIDERMRAEMDRHREAVAKIRDALAVTRPDGDAV
jgi:hypothetical protein